MPKLLNIVESTVPPTEGAGNWNSGEGRGTKTVTARKICSSNLSVFGRKWQLVGI